MKTLKFRPHLAERILAGNKTMTHRLFDDKDLTVGDRLFLVDKETSQEFAKAEIIEVRTKELGQLNDDDYFGHEKFDSEEQMYETYRKYYGDRVTPQTEVKIIKFKLI